MKFAKLAGVLAGFVICAAAIACAWDEDTVAQEAKGLPNVYDAVAGRLEINPPLYYEMRLKRVTEELKTNPLKLENYDNAGVASDKLGKSDDAIGWMVKKKTVLDANSFAADVKKDHLYRYHANLGTFYAHKWIKDRVWTKDSLLVKGIQELETALKINPNAHFGREHVQVKILKFLEKGKGKLYNESKIKEEFGAKEGRPEEFEILSDGIIGMMLLGSGAESPDMLHLLSIINSGNTNLFWMMHHRLSELSQQGKSTRVLIEEYVPPFFDETPTSKNNQKAAYLALRKNAIEFRENRDSYMLSRLKEGRHPDTDPAFWKDYHEVQRVNLEAFSPLLQHTEVTALTILGILLLLLCLAAGGVTLLVKGSVAIERMIKK